MIHLIGNLYSVEVPSDIVINKDELLNNLLKTTSGIEKVSLKILGEVTKDKINFPTADFLMKKIETQKDFYNGKVIDIEDVTYYNYESKEYDIHFQSDGFRSLLYSKGLFFKYCCGEFIDDGVVGETCCQKPNGIKGKLIILEKS